MLLFSLLAILDWKGRRQFRVVETFKILKFKKILLKYSKREGEEEFELFITMIV